MARYIDADEFIKYEIKRNGCVPRIDGGGYNLDRLDDEVNSFPTADVQEVRHCNPNDEYCVICNSELDESYANGIWDLSREICEALNLDTESMINDFQSNQDCVYGIIRNFIEHQNYCPNCGAKMDGKEDEE